MQKRFVVAALCAAVLSACGGSGGGNGGGAPPKQTTYSVGGTVTGLPSGLRINLSISILDGTVRTSEQTSVSGSATGPVTFRFPTEQPTNATYSVSVVGLDPPTSNLGCSIENNSGTGTMGTQAVSSIQIRCDVNSYTVGGTAIAVRGTGLQLQLRNSGNVLVDTYDVAPGVSPDVAFTFRTALSTSDGYAVSVSGNPLSPAQTCSVEQNGAGPAPGSGGGNVSNVSVRCVTQSFALGGSVSGLGTSGNDTGGLTLTLTSNDPAHPSQQLVIRGDGAFSFANPVLSGSTYTATISTQHAVYNCSLSGTTSGAVGNAASNGIAVSCASPIRVTVSGIGASSPGLILNNSYTVDTGNTTRTSENLPIGGNGTFQFPTTLPSGRLFTVTSSTPHPDFSCNTDSPGSIGGTVGASAINLNVTCQPRTYTVGGTVAGLSGSGLTLRLSGGHDLQISSNGAFSFSADLPNQTAYAVTTQSQPSYPAQNCTVTNGSGTINRANIANIVVSCADLPVPTTQADARLRALTLTWNAVATATSYNVYRSSARNCDVANYASCPDGALLTNVTSPLTISGLRNGTAYFVRVETVYANGARGLSVEDGARPNVWAFDTAVSAIATTADGTSYIGGGFMRASIATGSAAPIDAITGRFKSPDFPMVSGDVYAAAPDGNGGWYLGGNFTSVGGLARRNLARVRADNTVDPNWIADANDIVFGMAVSGTTLYAGGGFTTINGATRGRLAAIDANGVLLPFNPNANSTVNAIAIAGSNVYFGGNFTAVGGVTRNRLAAVDVNGVLQSWNPDLSSYVSAIAISATTIYVGGGFSTVGGVARNNVAAIDANGSLLAWSPNVSSGVYAIAVSGATIYIGGAFGHVNGVARNDLAAIDASGALLPWNPNPRGSYVTALATSGSTVYVGGSFDSIGDLPRDNLAAVNAAGQVQSWSPDPNFKVNAFAVAGDSIYVGGSFTGFKGTVRNGAAALAADGSLLPWNPDVNGIVSAIAISGSTIYIGGSFSNVGIFSHLGIAAISTDGVIQNINLNVNGWVYALAVSGSTLYVGGSGVGRDGTDRLNLLAINRINGQLESWNPRPNSAVTTLAVSGSTIYAGGWFTNMGITPRNRLAAIDANGTLLPWNPGADSHVYSIAVSGNTLYAGGFFANIGGAARNSLAAIDTVTGAVSPWNLNLNGLVNTLSIAGTTVYFGGQFTSAGGATRNKLAAIDTAGTLLPWNPNVENRSVNSLAVGDTTVRFGGDMTAVAGSIRGGFAEVSRSGAGELMP